LVGGRRLGPKSQSLSSYSSLQQTQVFGAFINNTLIVSLLLLYLLYCIVLYLIYIYGFLGLQEEEPPRGISLLIQFDKKFPGGLPYDGSSHRVYKMDRRDIINITSNNREDVNLPPSKRDTKDWSIFPSERNPKPLGAQRHRDFAPRGRGGSNYGNNENRTRNEPPPERNTRGSWRRPPSKRYDEPK